MANSIIKKALHKIRSGQANLRFKIFALKNKPEARVIEGVIEEGLTYLGKEGLLDLVQVIITNEKQGVEGIFVETGYARGGSAIAIANAKSKQRRLFIYDVFGTIPPPSEGDNLEAHQRYETIVKGNSEGLADKIYYGYEENLYTQVIEEFKNFGVAVNENNIHLIKGLYEDTLQIDEPVAFAHIDCDWYESVLTCLTQIEPHLSPGGTIIIDDYYHWSGCKAAVDKYFKNKNKDEYRFVRKSRLHIYKN